MTLRVFALILALLFPCIAIASMNINLDIIPPAPRSTEAYSFSGVTTFTELSQVTPSAACRTCFSQGFASNNGMRQASSVFIEVALMGYSANAQARLISYYYDASGNKIVDATWGTVSPPVLGMPKLMAVNITRKWNALWSGPLIGHEHAFVVEVIGTGTVYLARMRIDYL